MQLSGIRAFVELLVQHQAPYLFGNPGTTELPLNDVLVNDTRIKYILGLQEIPVMAMADGYAMASGRISVVNLHACCGLGNAMGQLYNAHREGTPLLVTAGQQDRRLQLEEPILGGDMVAVTRPWTKWSHEVRSVQELPHAVRRAIKTALTPPTGPVFLSLPLDVQMEVADDLDLRPVQLLDDAVRPPLEAIQRAATLLAEAKNPVILAGSRVSERNAVAELVSVAERLGAAVYFEAGNTHGRAAFPSDHPLNGQSLPMWSPDIQKRLAPFDVVFAVGLDLFRQYLHFEPNRPIPEHAKVVHLDEDAWQLGKNYELAVGVWSSIKAGLRELDQQLSVRMTADARQAAHARAEQHAAKHRETRERLQREIAKQRDTRPLTPLALVGALAEVLPPDVALIEEAVTTTNMVFERLGALKNTSGYFAQRGWTLGWGLGCAIGVKLAWPQRPVLAMLGEGASLYGIQGLWTAAHYNIPVTFVVCNNAQYEILKICGQAMQLPTSQAGQFQGMDLTSPEIDFVSLARSFGVEAHRITEPDELAQRVKASLAGDRPMLFDVPIARELPKSLDY
jgi:benzoylformate decarboxylase